MAVITPVKAVGSGVDVNGDVTGTVTALKEFATGDTVPPHHLGTGTPDATKVLKGDGSWGAASASVTQSAVTYLTSGGSTNISGKTVLAAYEQTAGATFTTPFTTESDYVQQDATNGTDHASGIFTLHATAGGSADSYTKLLIHADGTNGSTEIIDQRGITPFGTHCGYFDGTAYYTVPSSYKVAFGSSQDFTVECWFRLTSIASDFYILSFGGDNLSILVLAGGGLKFYKGGAGYGTSGIVAVDTWYHVAYVRAGGTLKVYLNGTQVWTGSDAYAYTNNNLSIGSYAATSAYAMKGWMDEIRISKVARYTANFTPHTTPHVRDADTVHLFHFDDGHGSQLLRDDSRSGHQLVFGGMPGGTTASISSTQAKFGTTSFFVGSTSNCGIMAAYSKPHNELIFGSDDFTIDCWFYPTGTAGKLFCYGSVASYEGPEVSLAAGGAITLNLSTNGSSWTTSAASLGTANLNAWNHFALTRSGANVYGFLNGTLQQTIGVSTSALFRGADQRWYIGRNDTSAAGYNGYLDEFRIKRGVAEWTANFTPPTSAYTTDDRTVLLLHFDGANGDKVTLDSSESSYGTWAGTDTTIPALTFQGGAALSSTRTRGGHATSLTLNGSDTQYAQMAIAAPTSGHPLYFGTGVYFCIEGWLYWEGDVASSLLFSFSDGGTGSNDLYCLLQASGQINTHRQSDSSVNISATNLTAGAWNHFAIVREPRGFITYVNGVGNTPTNPHLWLTASSVAQNFQIGNYQPRASGQGVIGSFDSFRVTVGKPRYTTNFTPGNLTQDDDTTLLWEFNGSVGQKWVKELSKNSAMIAATNARTVSDGVWITANGNAQISTAQQKFGTGSVYFDGSGDFLSIPDGSIPELGSQDWVMDMWVRPNATTGTIVVKRPNVSSAGSVQLYISSGNLLVYASSNGSTWDIVNGLNLYSSAVSNGVWTHLAVVRSGNTIRAYVNGTGGSSQGFTGTIYNSTDAWRVGGDSDGNYYSGYIDEFRISVGTDRGWTGSTITVPTAPYGNSYVSGPYWVATKPTVSSIDLSAYSSIDSVTFTTTLQPSTTLLYLISTDGYATPLKRWNGSAWVDTAYSMTWNGTTLTTTATSAQLNAVGNTQAEINTGLLALNVSAINSLNIVAILASSNASYTPQLDAIVIGTDAYSMIRPVTDYTVTKKKASGTQTLTLTKVSAGSGNLVFDYVE